QLREGAGAVDRGRVVDARADACRVELGQNLIAAAAGHPDAVDVPHVLVAVERHRQQHVQTGQQRVVPGGGRAAAFVPGRQAGRLGARPGRLQTVETAVHADQVVRVFRQATVAAQGADRGRELRRGGDDGARVAVRTEVLARVETGRGDAVDAGTPSVPGGA